VSRTLLKAYLEEEIAILFPLRPESLEVEGKNWSSLQPDRETTM
jgi:hypothetical protein